MRGVLFDVDDTLVDYSGAQQTAIVAYLASLGLEMAGLGGSFDIVVGHDAIGARDAGLRAVWLDRSGVGRGGDVPDGVARMTSLAELEAVVA